MWNLNFDRLDALAPPGGYGRIAIESGTCRGNGARALARKFQRVITIELSESLHEFAKEKLRSEEFSHIEFVNGDSASELRRLLPLLPPEPIFFFLDAHWSGDQSVDWSQSEWKGYGMDTAHLGESAAPTGPEQCPLAEELLAIMQFCKGAACILIDDTKNIPAAGQGLKNLTFQGEDWSHLSRDTLLSIVRPRLQELHELRSPEQWLLHLGPSS